MDQPSPRKRAPAALRFPAPPNMEGARAFLRGCCLHQGCPARNPLRDAIFRHATLGALYRRPLRPAFVARVIGNVPTCADREEVWREAVDLVELALFEERLPLPAYSVLSTAKYVQLGEGVESCSHRTIYGPGVLQQLGALDLGIDTPATIETWALDQIEARGWVITDAAREDLRTEIVTRRNRAWPPWRVTVGALTLSIEDDGTAQVTRDGRWLGSLVLWIGPDDRVRVLSCDLGIAPPDASVLTRRVELVWGVRR